MHRRLSCVWQQCKRARQRRRLHCEQLVKILEPANGIYSLATLPGRPRCTRGVTGIFQVSIFSNIAKKQLYEIGLRAQTKALMNLSSTSCAMFSISRFAWAKNSLASSAR